MSNLIGMGLRDGLVAEYLFRGSAEDTSGHGHHGVVQGATLAPDRFGAADCAYRFDGKDDAIMVSPPPPLTTGELSVSAWARFDRHRLEGWSSCIVSQDDGNDDDQQRRVFQLSAHDRHIVWHRMVCERDPICRRWIRFGEWYHVAATYGGGRHTLYLDGVRQDGAEGAIRFHPQQPLHIGRKGSNEPFFFFEGRIDDVRIYDRALSAEEVGELYRENGFAKPLPRRPAGSDPISGRWGRHGVNFLDLRLEPGGSVRGNVMHGRPEVRADIDTGTFDHATGALRLQGMAPHHKTGESLPWLIDGLLDEGEITVTATFGSFSGNFSLTRNGARWPWRHRLARSINRATRRILGLGRGDEE